MELFKHQQEALEQTKDLNRVAYYLDMGLGKTFVGAEKAMSLNKDILIVCQKSKIADWKEHFFKYYIDKMKCDESGAWCYDLTSNTGMDMFLHSRYRIRIGVINYELAWRRETELLNLHDFTLMLDESSLIQNQGANQSKFILKLNPDNVILLSGTPTAGKYENLWSQIHLLGWKISKDVYNRQYVNWTKIDMGGFTHKIVDKENPYKNVDRLKSKLREHGAVFMKTEECFDLPEQTFIKQTVPTSKEYWKFMKDCIITIDDKELVGDTTLTKRLYVSFILRHNLVNDSIVIHETPQDFQGFKCGSVFAGAIDDTLQVIQFDVNKSHFPQGFRCVKSSLITIRVLDFFKMDFRPILIYFLESNSCMV